MKNLLVNSTLVLLLVIGTFVSCEKNASNELKPSETIDLQYPTSIQRNIGIYGSSSCSSWLCWEYFAGDLECVESVTIALPNGVKKTIRFQAMPIISTVNGIGCTPTFPILSPIPVVGGYCEIATSLIAALKNEGFSVNFSMTGNQQNCMKGNSPLPGFFIKSDVQIVSINGEEKCGSGITTSRSFCTDCPYAPSPYCI